MGSWCFPASEDRTLKQWDATSAAELHTFEGHLGQVNSVAFSSDGRQVLSGSNDTTIKLWDASDGGLLRTFTGHSGPVNSIAFSSDGRQVLSGSSDGTMGIWNRATGELVASLLATPQGEWLTITPEGFFAASATSFSCTRSGG